MQVYDIEIWSRSPVSEIDVLKGLQYSWVSAEELTNLVRQDSTGLGSKSTIIILQPSTVPSEIRVMCKGQDHGCDLTIVANVVLKLRRW